MSKEDLIGYESKPVGAETHLRLLYMPLTGVETSKPVRKLVRTPWLIVDSSDCIDAHVGRCVPREKKSILMIVNPKSGKGDADALIENYCLPILEAAGVCVDKRVTEAPHHATEIMHETDVSGYDIILSAGGDGTFHEILQGLLLRDDWKECTDSMSLMQVPCGSGNALAASYGIWGVATAAYVAIKGRKSSIDVATIIQPSTNTIIFSFLSVTFGLIANLDIGTENLRWMGGQRFIWGAIKEILSQRVYACHVRYIENDESLENTTVSSAYKGPPLQFLGPLVSDEGTCRDVQGIDDTWEQVSGDFQLFSMSNLPWLDMNFNLHPHARMYGGSYNFLYCLGKQGIMKSLRLMTDSEKGLHMHLIEERQVKAFRIDPVAENTWLVIDGEAIERAPVYGEVHHGLISIVGPP